LTFGTFFDTPTTAVSGNGVRRWVPAMDLVETEEHFVLRADLPGRARTTSGSRSRTAR
jgi:HSP20 family protein